MKSEKWISEEYNGDCQRVGRGKGRRLRKHLMDLGERHSANVIAQLCDCRLRYVKSVPLKTRRMGFECSYQREMSSI